MSGNSGRTDAYTDHGAFRNAPVELLHGMNETIFGAAAPKMVRLGWSVFPQDMEGDRRRPGKVMGEMIRWEADHDLKHRLPTPEALESWCAHCGTLNVACVMGAGSGNAFAIDIDILDEDMAAAVVAIAQDILGPTPFMRVGRAPKVVMVYRHSDEDARNFGSTSKLFAAQDAEGNVTKGAHGLEILANGKPVTFHGRHHKTGNYFKWVGSSNPLVHGPSSLPLVSSDRVQTFIEAVDARFPFYRNTTSMSSASSWTWDQSNGEGLNVPRMTLSAGGDGCYRNEDGLVSDGREKHLTSLVFGFAVANPIRVLTALEQGHAEIQALQAEMSSAVRKVFETTSVIDQSGRFSAHGLGREVQSKVAHMLDRCRRGEVDLRRTPVNHNPDPSIRAPRAQVQDPELSFLRPQQHRQVRMIRGEVSQPEPGQVSYEIPESRDAIATMVQDGLTTAFGSFLDDVYRHGDEGRNAGPARVHVLLAPTGAGKTSRCIRMIAQDDRTRQEHEWVDPVTKARMKGRVPFVMLLPTYANIDELKDRAAALSLDGNLSDEDLRKQAMNLGLMAEDEMESRLADLRRDALGLGLDTMTYSGKLKAGCKVADKVQLAMAAGMGTSSLCKATVMRNQGDRRKGDKPTYEEVLCPHYDGCPAIAQRDRIRDVHLVFMPHSFLSLSIPPELQQVRGVIADERIHHLFLHTATFSATSLSIPRKPPRLTRKEKDAGMDPDELLSDRDMAAFVALDALRSGRCPASDILAHEPDGYWDRKGPPPGLGLVRSALRVCGSAMQRDGTMSPNTPLDEVRALCSRPTGKDLREEWQFWDVIRERMEALRHDVVRQARIDAARQRMDGLPEDADESKVSACQRSIRIFEGVPRKAMGDRDRRIQYLTDPSTNGGTSELVRVSWRTHPNWKGYPVLLLDASAAPPIISKIWNIPESDIILHDVVDDPGLALNVKIVGVVDRTYSNSFLAASPESTPAERMKAAKRLAMVRQALSVVSGMYGHGRIVAGTSILLREVIARDWECPDNVDWCHFGALRGLDGFKYHAAAFSIGRMEPPTRTIDGLAAALTYDDEVPEAPFDVRGDGMDPADSNRTLRLPLGPQRLRMRSGHAVTLKVPMFHGRWARLVQKQYREEELLQFVGRLRPVYREGRPPVWFALSSVIPETLVVDDLIEMDDLIGGNKVMFWEAVRRSGGVVEPSVLNHVSPHLVRGVQGATRAMEEMGFNLEGLPPTKRQAAGFAAWRWSSPSGDGGVAFVRGSMVDGMGKLVSRLGDAYGREDITAELLWNPDPGPFGLAARPRAPDTVDARIGPQQGRKAREECCLDKVGEMVLGTEGEIIGKSENSAFPVGLQQGVNGMNISEVGAYVALERFWLSRGGGGDESLMPFAPDGAIESREGDEDQDYASLASTTRDGSDFLAA